MLFALLLQVALVASPGAPVATHCPIRWPLAAARNVHAMRTMEPVRIDGILDDSIWTRATPVSGFVQREPKEGAPATERTDVRVVFDNGAIYIGAEMFDATPDSIRTQLARRDNWVSADRFYVFLDPYRDKRTGFYFALNASGVQYDGTLFNDDWDDNTWDGVWQGAVHRTPTGWTAEMRIPYSQLRFKPGAVPVWGINFKRDIARRNEQDYLTFTPSNGSGFVSRFPELQGLELNPPRRIELLPYTTAQGGVHLARPGRPVQRRLGVRHRRRRRLPRRARLQPDDQRHDQSRLRPGRGRPGGREPQRRGDLLSRAASLLRGGRQHLHQFRLRRLEQLLGIQLVLVRLHLHPPHRAGADGRHAG